MMQPVVLHRVCQHIAVANSNALTRAGITSRSPDPCGGTIDRQRVTSDPTGARHLDTGCSKYTSPVIMILVLQCLFMCGRNSS